VLSPILPAVAADFGVSTTTAGQLRAVSGSVAGGVALAVGLLAAGRSLRSLLLVGLSVLAIASAASAAAPTFALLAVAQAGVGVGLALVLSSAVAAAGEWEPGRRSKVLSWALIGQPAAWIVGMPIVGAVGDLSWRYAWVAVPLVASILSLAAVATCPRARTRGRSRREGSALRVPGVRGWAMGEFLAYSAWAGVIVFAGAFFIETYAVSVGTAGLLLAAAAIAYLPGNFLARRWVDRAGRWLIIGAVGASAVVVIPFGASQPGVGLSAGMLAVLAFLAGARTIAGSAVGMDSVSGAKIRTMSLRTAAVQFGYLGGAAVGGAMLAGAGYAGVGAAFAVLYLCAAVPHVLSLVRGRGADREPALSG
jgi:MFS transporter, DHA1 family, inner membrane transport protein